MKTTNPDSPAACTSTSRTRHVAILTVLIGAAILFGVTTLAARASSRQVALDGRIFLPSVMVPRGLELIPTGKHIRQPVSITHARDDRLFIGQRSGEIVILHPNGSETVFLDISDRVVTNGSEYGFYDIAFHPLYEQTGLFYVSYTGQISETVYLNISRFRVTDDPNIADPATETIMLQMEQTSPVHKGGALDFDRRDHHLYAGIGEDWKSPYAQDPLLLNGKIVRFDVDRVPLDATGVITDVAPPELVSMGLRNPWRIDVDEQTDRLFIADVGSSAWEEINIQPLSQPILNFGWPCREGPDTGRDVPEGFQCDPEAIFTEPAYAYAHEGGRCAVIGGGVYRPESNPGDGRYMLADFCSREVMMLSEEANGQWTAARLGVADLPSLVITAGTGPQGQKFLGAGVAVGPIYEIVIP